MTRTIGCLIALLLMTGACAADEGSDQDPAQVDEIAAIEAALAAPKFQTLTVLNQTQNLASNLSGKMFTVAPSPSSFLQQFELLFPGSAGSSEPTFGSAFQLQNRSTQKCVEDVAAGLQVVEVGCVSSPPANSPQLWQHHTFADRIVGGKSYNFLFSRSSKRVLSRSQIGVSAQVLSSPKATNEGSAAASLQLWTLTKL